MDVPPALARHFHRRFAAMFLNGVRDLKPKSLTSKESSVSSRYPQQQSFSLSIRLALPVINPPYRA